MFIVYCKLSADENKRRRVSRFISLCPIMTVNKQTVLLGKRRIFSRRLRQNE
ncbi:hypothetical protein SGGMMB4_03996 [Sodalis glossinidius str. 'morsitans']|uniref:Uncharacterized protein n=1 Tax=Sodalis glossinidius (strain morsitans) TaxID=343509 RepID=A0A193QL36_SODGM|nr:hypothetical protein SGGMMB4_03996 [Sodalis glossinidius str. 'morsitans']